MVALQIISKIIQSKDFSIITENQLDVTYFTGYEDEFNFIENHIKEYGNVPDKATFLAKFDMDLVEVTESDAYLVTTIREENLYYRSVPVVQKIAKLLQTDANAAAEYMIAEMKNLQPNYNIGGVDIVASAHERYNQYVERKAHQDDWFFTTGFEELDEITHGLQRGEELLVIVARTNQGKSWMLEKMCTHVWELGFNVGYISAEMGANSIGYRFDTLRSNFSNKGLMWGKNDVNDAEYKDYIDKLKEVKNKFIVATPQDFANRINVSKLKNWVKQYKLDLIAVDGITYLDDERYRRGDSKTTSLTNISEDLMALSMEMKIPVLVVVQANRSGAYQDDKDGTPELESIRDSDGISHNASKVISIRQLKEDNVLKLEVKKQRFGAVGGKLSYKWDINTGKFDFMPTFDDAQPKEKTERKIKKQVQNKEDVF